MPNLFYGPYMFNARDRLMAQYLGMYIQRVGQGVEDMAPRSDITRLPLVNLYVAPPMLIGFSDEREWTPPPCSELRNSMGTLAIRIFLRVGVSLIVKVSKR